MLAALAGKGREQARSYEICGSQYFRNTQAVRTPRRVRRSLAVEFAAISDGSPSITTRYDERPVSIENGASIDGMPVYRLPTVPLSMRR